MIRTTIITKAKAFAHFASILIRLLVTARHLIKVYRLLLLLLLRKMCRQCIPRVFLQLQSYQDFYSYLDNLIAIFYLRMGKV